MRKWLVLAAIVAVAGGGAGSASAHRGASDTVLQWYDATAQAVSAAGLPEQVSQDRVWAVAWLAAARATAGPQDERYANAALASALHDTLVRLVPAKQASLDAQLDRTLGAIPDSLQKTRGADAGRAAATQVLQERQGDGLDTASVDRPWTPPAPAPGVYRLTGGPAVRAGLPDATPFVIRDRDQFDPGPPPPLDSPVYLAALAEDRAVGGADSTVRTPEQTAVARFWAQASVVTYTQVVREVLEQHAGSTGDDARLVAAFHAIEIDQQIAIHAAKYRYVFWRPVTAIGDPAWTPLISTPRHPEYPSGHAGYGGTADAVLAALAPDAAHATYSASSTTAGGATRSWTGWRAITDETIDARVWEGVHFRFSDEVGARVGRAVAAYDLKHLDAIGL